MSQFAKLYEDPEKGQILVLLQDAEDGAPEVRVFFEPEGYGVCSAAVGWDDDSDESWNAAQKTLEQMTEEKARGFVKSVCPF